MIVEHELLGGECSYWACMPSKALLRPVELLDAARRMPGVSARHRWLDAAGRRAAVLDAAGTPSPATTTTSARCSGPTTPGSGSSAATAGSPARSRVEVTGADGGTRTLTARHAVVLATGTTATVPPIPGLREALPWTCRDVTNADEVPRRLAVLGGGVVACEIGPGCAGSASRS